MLSSQQNINTQLKQTALIPSNKAVLLLGLQYKALKGQEAPRNMRSVDKGLNEEPYVKMITGRFFWL
jgi:hypothetical protein